MHWNHEFRTALEKQWLSLRNADLSTQHKWLCHPGDECKDGCDTAALPERLAAMDSVENTVIMAELNEYV